MRCGRVTETIKKKKDKTRIYVVKNQRHQRRYERCFHAVEKLMLEVFYYVKMTLLIKYMKRLLKANRKSI